MFWKKIRLLEKIMADLFLRAWKFGRSGTVQRVERVQTLANGAYAVERRSCVKISSLWRACVARAEVSIVFLGVKRIQRLVRGKFARERARLARRSFGERLEEAYLESLAVDVQRSFRGFYSRRYRHDFSARKAYIQGVMKEGEALRERLKELQETQAKEKAEKDEARKLENFQKATQRLHYLVSTKAIPGIYNSPYWPKRTVMGIPLEHHLSKGVRDLRHLRENNKKKKNKALLKHWIPDRRSLRCAGDAYDAQERDAKLQKKLQRASFIGAADFCAGQKVHYPPHQKGVHCSTKNHDTLENNQGTKKQHSKTPYFYSTVSGADSFDTTLLLERDRLLQSVKTH